MIGNGSNSSKLKVSHNYKDINEGVDYEMVLKDSNVLDEEDDNDILENVDLKAVKKKEPAEKLIKTSIDEKGEILPQYSKKSEDGFVIAQQGLTKNTSEEDSKSEINKVKERLKGAQSNPIFLPKVEKNTNSDYLTQEEFKVKEFKKKKIQKKGITSVETLSSEERQKLNKSASDKNSCKGFDEYEELNKFLDVHRSIANKAKISTNPEEKVREMIQKGEKIEGLKNKILNEEPSVIDSLIVNESTEFLKNVPTKRETEETLSNITSNKAITFSEPASGTSSVVNMTLATDRLRYGIASLTPVDSDDRFLGRKRGSNSMVEDNMTAIDSVAEETIGNTELEEPSLGKGIGLALKVFRQRGMIGKNSYVGRYKDAVPQSGSNKPNEIDITYRDDKGRLMTGKEAFRYMCYIVHNDKPGKKKVEKRLLRDQLEQRRNNIDVSKDSRILKYLKQQQEKNNVPYLVLQGKNNPMK